MNNNSQAMKLGIHKLINMAGCSLGVNTNFVPKLN